MELIHTLFNFLIHIDQHLIHFSNQYGAWTYAILFSIVFAETGLVIIPFLPGDSLLFASGTLIANQHSTLNIHYLFILLVLASIVGNTSNYFIGKFIGPKVFRSERSLWLNRKYLEYAHQFYRRFGGKTIVFARFLPIIRTFAPFVAGIGSMKPVRFMAYNILGAFTWVGSLLYSSYLFGNLAFVQNNFSHVILGIILLSILPALLGLGKELIKRS